MTGEARLHNTVVWHVVRGTGTWLAGAAAVLLLLLALQRDGDDWRAVLVFALVVGAVGLGMMGVGHAQISRRDALNRPLLDSPDAHVVLRSRGSFDARVLVIRRWLLVALVPLTAVWVLVVSVQSCAEVDHSGICAWERPGDAWNTVLLVIGVLAGTGVGALTLMHDAYQRESDRLGQKVADAAARRRLADPLAGIGRGGWSDE